MILFNYGLTDQCVVVLFGARRYGEQMQDYDELRDENAVERGSFVGALAWLVQRISSLARSPADVCMFFSFSFSFLSDFLKEPSSSGSGKASSSSGTKRKSSSSSKAAKDGKPKRAATSFMLFSSANRDKIKADDPSMDVSG